MLNWIILGAAIVAEVIGTLCLKVSDGLARPLPVVGVVVFYVVSFIGLALALRTIDVSIAYAIWAGLGVVLVMLVGVTLFGEPLTAWRLVCVALILLGVVGLYLAPD
jgi:small multidrug resistance pump